MISRPNYRVKIDLSKHYRDARRSSWIYVDGESIHSIQDLKNHIADIFGIQETFYLLLSNQDYLPPKEDVRIIKENELITVVTGSDTQDPHALTTPIQLPGLQQAIVTHTTQSTVLSNVECYEDDSKIHNNIEETDSATLNNLVEDASPIRATNGHIAQENPEVKPTTSHSKETDDNCSTVDPYDGPVHKRRRIRRKRSKNGAVATLTEHIKHEPVPVSRGTNMSQLPVLPKGKHIHFDNADDTISTVVEKRVNNKPSAENAKRKLTEPILPTIDNSRTAQLSTLLALKRCSTPVEFVNTKPMHVNKNISEASAKNTVEAESCGDPKSVQTNADMQQNGNNDAANAAEEPDVDYSNFSAEKYPRLENVTELNDIITFKMLRIGNDYTPEISDYLVARTISWCPKTSLYTFQLLKGQMQIQPPLGKFSMLEDETVDQQNETVTADFTQLIDPRLIYRK